MSGGKRYLLVTNFCPFYRVGLFNILLSELPVRILFYSRGTESYWEKSNRTGMENPGCLSLARDGAGRLKTLWRLAGQLWGDDVAGVIQGFNGAPYILLGYLAARLRGLPFGIWTGLWYHPSTPLHRLTRPLVDFLYRHADFAVAYGTHVRDYLVSRGMRPEKIFIAQNTADNRLYNRAPDPERQEAIRQAAGLAAGETCLLYVGRFSAEKGPRELLRALALVKEPPRLIMIGQGPEREWCENFARERALPVHFAGYVANEELYNYYSLAKVVVIPSVTRPELKEAWSLTVNECMNQGCAVIASDAVGAAAGGLVEEGRTGLIVPEQNPAALAAAIERLVSDASLREAMGAAARAKIAKWDYSAMAEGFRQAVALMEGLRK